MTLLQNEKLVMSTQTTEGGSYVFTPLASATYTVVASHPHWTLLKDKVSFNL